MGIGCPEFLIIHINWLTSLFNKQFCRAIKYSIMAKQISYKQEVFRKLIHLSSLWMVFSLALLPKSINIFIFSLLLIVLVLVEYGYYKQWSLFVLLYGRFFGQMLREKEKGKKFTLSGAPYVLAAALMVTLLFEQTIAMIALSVMLIGDTCAALIGRKFGKHKINNATKSIEGAFAFWISSICVLLVFICIYNKTLSFFFVGVIGITLAMLAEIYEKQIRIDDNFSIPLIVGISLSLLTILSNL